MRVGTLGPTPHTHGCGDFGERDLIFELAETAAERERRRLKKRRLKRIFVVAVERVYNIVSICIMYMMSSSTTTSSQEKLLLLRLRPDAAVPLTTLLTTTTTLCSIKIIIIGRG